MEQAWKQLSTWALDGHLQPVIGMVLPWAKISDAYRLLKAGKNYGKIVIKMD
jgi:NADPH:quinone reductase-like Zn-dependent oxidoreductase